jgi:hypothetical protein
VALALFAGFGLGCHRSPVEINPIEVSVQVNQAQAPLGSAIEVTYTWKVGDQAKPVPAGYRAFVHFLDSEKVVLFTDDHVPEPAPETWKPGEVHTYTRTVFVPVYPYVGPSTIGMGLYTAGKGQRIAMKGEDLGMRSYKAGSIELLPQTDSIFLVYKEGWHNPEPHPDNPQVERTWTKKEALLSFKNPKSDVVIYLEAATSPKFFQQSPVLNLTVGGKVGVTLPIENSEVFLKRIQVKAADLGDGDFVDLKLAMNESFVPNKLNPPMNTDDRELGVMVYHLYVGEKSKLGPMTGLELLSAAPTAAGTPAKAAAKKPASKP